MSEDTSSQPRFSDGAPGWQRRWGRKRRGPKLWTLDDVRRLRGMVEQNHSWESIARTLKRSTISVKTRARMHGIPAIERK